MLVTREEMPLTDEDAPATHIFNSLFQSLVCNETDATQTTIDTKEAGTQQRCWTENKKSELHNEDDLPQTTNDERHAEPHETIRPHQGSCINIPAENILFNEFQANDALPLPFSLRIRPSSVKALYPRMPFVIYNATVSC